MHSTHQPPLALSSAHGLSSATLSTTQPPTDDQATPTPPPTTSATALFLPRGSHWTKFNAFQERGRRMRQCTQCTRAWCGPCTEAARAKPFPVSKRATVPAGEPPASGTSKRERTKLLAASSQQHQLEHNKTGNEATQIQLPRTPTRKTFPLQIFPSSRMLWPLGLPNLASQTFSHVRKGFAAVAT